MLVAKALLAPSTHRHDYLTPYVRDLNNVVDMEAIRASGIHVGVDPLGGAGVHYWAPIAALYRLNLKVVNDVVDPTFRFMTLDWDGRIRMDPSSPYAMRSLMPLKRIRYRARLRYGPRSAWDCYQKQRITSR
jgi:phosphoglucomutase